MCKYCEDNVDFNVDSSLDEISIIENDLYIKCSPEYSVFDYYVPIKYCPMCGKRLKNKIEEDD